MRYDYEGIERLPIRPRIKVSVIDGECWFIAQDVWEAIGASRSALKGVPKAFTQRIPIEEGTKKATAVNLAGLMYLMAGMGVRLGLPTENTALLVEHTSNGERLESGKECLEAYGRDVCIVLSGAAECISAIGQARRDLKKRMIVKQPSLKNTVKPKTSHTGETIPTGEQSPIGNSSLINAAQQ